MDNFILGLVVGLVVALFHGRKIDSDWYKLVHKGK